jgi:hypothetical protein
MEKLSQAVNPRSTAEENLDSTGVTYAIRLLFTRKPNFKAHAANKTRKLPTTKTLGKRTWEGMIYAALRRALSR